MPLRLSTGLRDGLLGSDDFKGLLTDCVIEIYSGSQPASADAAETGTKLCRITVGSGAFTGGQATNGLEFGTPSAGVINKASAETWSGVGLADGTAGWFRCYANAYTTGASTSAVRFDGTVGTSGQQLNLSSVAIKTGVPVYITDFPVTLPANT